MVQCVSAHALQLRVNRQACRLKNKNKIQEGFNPVADQLSARVERDKLVLSDHEAAIFAIIDLHDKPRQGHITTT